MIGSNRDDRQFRRGVVLGLTMAEALLLMIFLLLLILAIKLKDQASHIASLQQERDAAQSTLAAVQPVLARLSQQQKFDITKDYVRIQQQLDQATARLKDAQLSVDLIQQAEAALPALKPEDAAKALLNEAAIGRQALDAAHRFQPDMKPEDAVQALLDAATIGQALAKSSESPQALLANAAACKADLQSCSNQRVYLNTRLNAKTGGFDLPPCWADKAGHIQYIFDASLYDEGIYVENDGVAGREADQEKLPLGRARFNAKLEKGEFAAAFAPLLDWSNQHGCRFYVKLFDEMKSGDRARYKELRGTVEGYFRILLSY
jgi:hypothetical protein